MKYFLGIGGFVIALLTLVTLIGLLSPIAEVGESLQASIDRNGGVEYLAEPAIDILVDRLNESGFDRRPLRADEPLLAHRTILISEGINERVASHVMTRLIHLNAIDPKTPIELKVTTSGGWLDSAFAIVDTMRSLEAPVNITAVGGCYSAGTVILAGGTGTRSATPNAVLSVHVNDYYRDGDAFDSDRQELERFRRIYATRSRVPKEWFDEPGNNQYYFNATQALEMELIDRIAEPARSTEAAEAPALAPAA